MRPEGMNSKRSQAHRVYTVILAALDGAGEQLTDDQIADIRRQLKRAEDSRIRRYHVRGGRG